MNFYNIRLDKGISSYNQPLNDTLSVLYDLPVGAGRHFDPHSKALNLIAGGWGVNLINTMTSGLPAFHHLRRDHASFSQFAHQLPPESDRSAALPIRRSAHCLSEPGRLQPSQLHAAVRIRVEKHRQQPGVL